MSPSGTPLLRGSFLAFIALAAIAYTASSWWGIAHAGDVTGGMVLDARGFVAQVIPGSAASKAGIVPGDRYVATATSPRDAFLLTENQVAGTVLHVAIAHGGHVSLRTLDLQPSGTAADVFSYLKRPIALALVLIAIILLLLRPQAATRGFFCYALLVMVLQCNQYWSYPAERYYNDAQIILGPFAGVALLYFAVAFSGEARRGRTPLLGIAAAGCLAQSAAGVIAGSSSGVPVAQWWTIALAVLTLFVLVHEWMAGRRSNRQRIAWVIAGIAYAVAFEYAVPGFVSLSAAAVSASRPLAFFYALEVLSPVAVGTAVLYAMLQYRVLDIRFALNRAIVYAATTTVAVAFFAVIEWAASRVFEGTNAASYAGFAAALIIGFAANAFHKRVDALIDLAFFRRERRAAERLRHLTASLQFVDDEATVEQFVVREPARLLDLASAAIFISGAGGDFMLHGHVGWDGHDGAMIPRADPLVPQLRAAAEPLWLRDAEWHGISAPSGSAEPLIAVPIKARADLFGFVLYGGHANGATINGEERALLASLCAAAASAYDHIEAARARSDVQQLTAELQLLTRLQGATTQ